MASNKKQNSSCHNQCTDSPKGSMSDHVHNAVECICLCADMLLKTSSTHSPGSRFVHLVDKGYSWDGVVLCLPPHSDGLGLYSHRAVQQGHRTIQDTQRTLHLKCKINMACQSYVTQDKRWVTSLICGKGRQ